MDKGEAIMPTPEGILSTTTGAVDASINEAVEETTQDNATSEEANDTESEVVEGGSEAEDDTTN